MIQRAIRALVLTREYVGEDVLPTIAGWEWFDTCNLLAKKEPGGDWSREFLMRTKTCPNCGDKSMVFPRESTPFCEDSCGWPDEDRTSMEST